MEEPVHVPVTFATGFEVRTTGGISELVFYEDRYCGHGRPAKRIMVKRVTMEAHKLEDCIQQTPYTCVRGACDKRVKPLKR